MIGRGGTTKKRGKLPPVPEYPGKMTKRAESRARVQLDRDKDFAKLDAKPGVMLLVEALFADGFEVVAGDVYAVHPEFRLVDMNLRAPLSLETRDVVLRRTSLGVMA
jgi:hypothetical protein